MQVFLAAFGSALAAENLSLPCQARRFKEIEAKMRSESKLQNREPMTPREEIDLWFAEQVAIHGQPSPAQSSRASTA